MTSAQERERQPLLRTMFGAVLRRRRLEQGRTLADVARAAKVSMPYLSELERGRKEASSEVLAAICAALGMELSDLLAEARRDLVRLAPVIRLDRADGGPHGSLGPGSLGRRSLGGNDVVCLLAA